MVKDFDGQALDVSAPFLELCKSKKIVQKQPEQFGKNNPDRDRLPNVVPDVQFGSPAWSRGDGMGCQRCSIIVDSQFTIAIPLSTARRTFQLARWPHLAGRAPLCSTSEGMA